ncbi:MAG: major capsid protein [Chaetfec virus UA24_2735]|nr:MAG: major capsid protein [Chaetfec virus UA24_2735]
MANIFNSIYFKRPASSRHNLVHENKLSCNLGRLVPFMCEEVLPGDKWSVLSSFRLELAPLVAPLMHNMDVFCYFFYVPNDILSSAWDSWITQGEPADSPNIPYPARFTLTQPGTSKMLSLEDLQAVAGPGTLLDYLNFSNEFARAKTTPPTTDITPMSYSVLPIQAYHAIWLNFFRNENFTPLPNVWGNPGGFNADVDQTQNINQADWKAWNFYYRNNVSASIYYYFTPGDDEDPNNPLRLLPHKKPRRANYMHDYFTASLPFTQRGPVVRLPIGNSAPVVLNDDSTNSLVMKKSNHGGFGTHEQFFGVRPSTGQETELPLLNGSTYVSGTEQDARFVGDTGTQLDPNGTLEADLSEATGISVLDLRRLSRLQQWLEKNATGGGRPGEVVYNHFGVKPRDTRYCKPLFLGGGRVPIEISNVLQTSQTTETSPQATPSGYARSQGFAGFKRRYFDDYGWIMGLLYVMPRSQYIQGTRRYWDRGSRFDYFWPEFERIGEQPVFNWEIYDNGLADGINNGIFGYNPRYSDYKYIPSTVHGDFKTSLSFWHAARIFSSRPNLNSSFLHLGSDIDRIFSVFESQSDQRCWFWIRNQVKVRRKMLKNPQPDL